MGDSGCPELLYESHGLVAHGPFTVAGVTAEQFDGAHSVRCPVGSASNARRDVFRAVRRRRRAVTRRGRHGHDGVCRTRRRRPAFELQTTPVRAPAGAVGDRLVVFRPVSDAVENSERTRQQDGRPEEFVTLVADDCRTDRPSSRPLRRQPRADRATGVERLERPVDGTRRRGADTVASAYRRLQPGEVDVHGAGTDADDTQLSVGVRGSVTGC